MPMALAQMALLWFFSHPGSQWRWSRLSDIQYQVVFIWLPYFSLYNAPLFSGRSFGKNVQYYDSPVVTMMATSLVHCILFFLRTLTKRGHDTCLNTVDIVCRTTCPKSSTAAMSSPWTLKTLVWIPTGKLFPEQKFRIRLKPNVCTAHSYENVYLKMKFPYGGK